MYTFKMILFALGLRTNPPSRATPIPKPGSKRERMEMLVRPSLAKRAAEAVQRDPVLMQTMYDQVITEVERSANLGEVSLRVEFPDRFGGETGAHRLLRERLIAEDFSEVSGSDILNYVSLSWCPSDFYNHP